MGSHGNAPAYLAAAYAAALSSLVACCTLGLMPILSSSFDDAAAAERLALVKAASVATHLVASSYLRWRAAMLSGEYGGNSNASRPDFGATLCASLLNGFSVFASATFCTAVALMWRRGELLAVIAAHVCGNWYYSFARVKFGSAQGDNQHAIEKAINVLLPPIYTLADLHLAIEAYHPDLGNGIALQATLLPYIMRTVGDLLRLAIGADRIAAADRASRERARS